MSNKVRVIALDDDNHDISFHTEWRKDPYHNSMAFIRQIAKPHECKYDIRSISLLDIDEDDEKLTLAFDVVQSGGHYAGMNYYVAFEHLWEHASDTAFGSW